ncbi:hypothetical protein [Solidesulfovibrio sp.]
MFVKNAFQSGLLLWVGLVFLAALQPGCSAPQPEAEDRLLESAREAFVGSRFLAAETAYEAYLQHYPTGGARLEAWLRLADISADIRESPGQAATLLEAALLETDISPAAAARLRNRAASWRFSRKEYAKAEQHGQAVLDLPEVPPDLIADSFLLLARLDIARHDESRALARYAACRDSRLPGSEAARCTLAQAELLLRLERPTEAEPLLQTLFDAAQLAPALRAQAGFSLGQIIEAQNDKIRAKALYESLRPLHPNPAVVDKRLEYLHN